MKYTINPLFEIVKNNTGVTALFTGEVKQVFVLNQIESIIFQQFSTPSEIESAYEEFINNTTELVSRDDYFSFMSQLIDHMIVIKADD